MSLSSSNATGTPFSIRVLRYDGTEHRRWNARLARRDRSLIVLEAEFDVEVQHLHLGHIPLGARTVEYYWQNRWYNVFEFLDDAGKPRLWYCNVNLPPVIAESSITYVDLDLDIIVRTDFSYQILDSDEFEQHARIFGYPEDVQESARKALTELISRIENRQFPFTEMKVN
jgi:protein associated with RNAse G/E